WSNTCNTRGSTPGSVNRRRGARRGQYESASRRAVRAWHRLAGAAGCACFTSNWQRHSHEQAEAPETKSLAPPGCLCHLVRRQTAAQAPSSPFGRGLLYNPEQVQAKLVVGELDPARLEPGPHQQRPEVALVVVHLVVVHLQRRAR